MFESRPGKPAARHDSSLKELESESRQADELERVEVLVEQREGIRGHMAVRLGSTM